MPQVDKRSSDWKLLQSRAAQDLSDHTRWLLLQVMIVRDAAYYKTPSRDTWTISFRDVSRWTTKRSWYGGRVSKDRVIPNTLDTLEQAGFIEIVSREKGKKTVLRDSERWMEVDDHGSPTPHDHGSSSSPEPECDHGSSTVDDHGSSGVDDHGSATSNQTINQTTATNDNPPQEPPSPSETEPTTDAAAVHASPSLETLKVEGSLNASSLVGAMEFSTKVCDMCEKNFNVGPSGMNHTTCSDCKESKWTSQSKPPRKPPTKREEFEAAIKKVSRNLNGAAENQRQTAFSKVASNHLGLTGAQNETSIMNACREFGTRNVLAAVGEVVAKVDRGVPVPSPIGLVRTIAKAESKSGVAV